MVINLNKIDLNALREEGNRLNREIHDKSTQAAVLSAEIDKLATRRNAIRQMLLAVGELIGKPTVSPRVGTFGDPEQDAA